MYDPLRAKAKIALYTVIAFAMGLGLASGMGWTDTSLAMPVINEAPQVSEAAVAPAKDLSEAFVNISEVVTPAVVRVEARRPLSANRGRNLEGLPEQFRRFFEPEMPEQREGPDGSQWAGGSGFIVSSDGYILTNNHVVEGSDEVRIAFSDRRVVPARVIGLDPFTDVAVVKVDVDEALPTLSFGDSDDVQPGEWILAIGNPGFTGGTPLDFSVTAGIVSARGRGLRLIQRELQGEFGLDSQLPGYAIEDFIQTDAVINPGNSGGPMVDLMGRVVGINSAIASSTGFYQGYGFAIPINLARRVMEDLIEYGQVQRPRLGVSIDEVDPEDAEVYGLPNVSGVLVQEVPADGPAQGVLQAEDVIVAIDGEPVTYVGQLQGMVAMRRPGDRVTVTVYRDREPRDVTIRLGEAPLNEAAPAQAAVTEAAEERLGIFVSDLTPEVADDFGYEAGETGAIVTRIVRGSPAARRNVLMGWKIVEINDTRIAGAADVRDALAEVAPGSVVRLLQEDPSGTLRVANVRMPGN